MKRMGIIAGGIILCAAVAGYYFVVNKPNISWNKKPASPECVTDVIEMKSGSTIMGKILKETPGSVLIRNAAGTAEIAIPKKQITTIRKATADDVKAVQDELARAPEEAKKAMLSEKEREARLSKYYEERNRSEVAAASRYRDGTDSTEAVRAAKDSGKIIKGMSESDVIEVYGPPDSKKAYFGGNAERERWVYSCGKLKGATVNFYKGKVE